MTKKQRTLLESNEIYVGTGSDNNGQCAAIMACLAELDAAKKVVEAAKAVARADGIAVVGAKQKQAWAMLKLHESVDAYDKIKEQGL